MKYRIKQEEENLFVPQWRSNWVPIWEEFKQLPDFAKILAFHPELLPREEFERLDEAMDFIKNQKEDEAEKLRFRNKIIKVD